MYREQEYMAAREILGLRCDSSGEYTLPDYNGDVRKILAVKAKALPAGSFVGEDTLDISGSIRYEVVYIDAQNSITHAEFVTDYDAAVKVNSETYVDSDVRTTVAGCNMRLIGPRKMSVKCALESDIRISERRSEVIDGETFVEGNPEVKTVRARVNALSCLKGEAKELSEVMESLDGAILDEVEILLSDATVRCDSFDYTEGVLEINGSVLLCLLYKNGEDEPRLITREIPYSERILGEVGLEAFELFPRVDLTALKCTVEPNDTGVTISLNLSLLPSAIAKANSTLTLCEDAYLKERGCYNEYSDFSYTEHLGSEESEFAFECRVPTSELDVDGDFSVIYADAHCRIDSCDVDKNEVQISGTVRFNAIASQMSDDGTLSYYPLKIEDKFKKNVNINCQISDITSCNCTSDIYDVKVENDGNNVVAKCCILLSASLESHEHKRCISASYLTDEEYVRDESVVVAYYPDDSETLFDIAKRFHTSVGAIAARNRLTEEAFASSSATASDLCCKRLIIG